MQICTVELVFHGNVEWNMYFEGMHPVQVATYSSLIFHYSIHSIILLWLLHITIFNALSHNNVYLAVLHQCCCLHMLKLILKD